ncbi:MULTISPECIES: hypothetical protein [unclassified Kitasatospora]|uniref:hypothetical protein n=1 Tax=unclassified Kitasatospora TaxID=2633591 RepID=UPI0033CB19E4
MSYEIFFVDLRHHSDWTAAMTAHEGVQDPGVPDELARAWRRIVPRALEILGEAQAEETERWREIRHAGSGLQLSVYGGDVSMQIPYGHEGEQADTFMALAYRLAALVTEETGLTAVDPQTGATIASPQPAAGPQTASAQAAGIMAETATWLQHY